MKKPSATKLRPRGLAQEKLAKASGGRGIVKGYIECSYCHLQTAEGWINCPSCGRGYSQAVSYNGPGGVRSV